MCYKNKNRASAYILVVSVITTLALIGSIFLMSALDERRASEARVETAPAVTSVDSVMDQICNMLLADLAIRGEDGPYSDNSDWRAYIDYPSPDPGYHDDQYNYDDHLASYERAMADGNFVNAGCWPKVSNIAGYDPRLVVNVNPAWRYIPTSADGPSPYGDINDYLTYNIDSIVGLRSDFDGSSITNIPAPESPNVPNVTDFRYRDNDDSTPDCIPLIDADGDGIRDSLLFATDSYSGSGETYYAAVRIIDISGLVNINTSYHTEPNGFSPAWLADDGTTYTMGAMTVGMISPVNLPIEWPELNHTPTHTPSTWAFTDYNDNNSFNSGSYEEYAPGFGWLNRQEIDWTDGTGWLINRVSALDMETIDGGITSGTRPATVGRGVSNDDADTSYFRYFKDYIGRMTNIDPTSSTAGNFSPFGISDEIACRWNDSVKWEDNSTARGGMFYDSYDNHVGDDNMCKRGDNKLKPSRLARLIEEYTIDSNDDDPTDPDDPMEHWAYYSRYLTTMSSSREVARLLYNDDYNWSYEDDWDILPVKVDVNLPLDTNERREIAFHAYRRAFARVIGADVSSHSSSISIDDANRACQLAVNLIDYRDDDDEPTYYNAGLVGGDRIVAGVERFPVISHAWACHEWEVTYDITEGENTIDAQNEYVMVVLYNPYSSAIDLDNYEFGGESISDPIGPQEYKVYADEVATVRVNTAYSLEEINSLNAYDNIELTVTAKDLTGANPISVTVDSFDWDDEGNVVSYIRPTTDNEGYHVGAVLFSRDVRPGYYHELIDEYLDRSNPVVSDSSSYPTCNPSITTEPQLDFRNVGTTSEEFASLGAWDNNVGDPEYPIFVRGYDTAYNLQPAVPVGFRLANLGELCRLLDHGPGGTQSLDEEIYSPWAVFGSPPVGSPDPDKQMSLFHFDSLGFKYVPSGVPYVEVSEYARITDYFTVDSPLTDGIDNDGDGYRTPFEYDSIPASGSSYAKWDKARCNELSLPGRININTAPVAALAALPYILPVNTEGDRLAIAGTLVSYRDSLGRIPGAHWDLSGFAPDFFSNRNDISSSNLRSETGFSSAGEMSSIIRTLYDAPGVPLNTDYNTSAPHGPSYFSENVDSNYQESGDDDGYDTNLPSDDLTKHEMPWTYLSNLVTVNSDVYCAYIWIQEGPELYADGRRYMAIIDRSNCYKSSDKPMIKALVKIPVE